MKHLLTLLAVEFTKRRMTVGKVNERQVGHKLEGESYRLYQGTAQILPEECEEKHNMKIKMKGSIRSFYRFF
jgi:hypothetical protein